MIDHPAAQGDEAEGNDNPNKVAPTPAHLRQIDEQTEDSTEDQQRSTQKAYPLKDGPKWTDKAIVLLTGGIVLLAFMQWREMSTTGVQTDKIIAADQRLATAMENSVQEAGKSLDAAIAQTQLDQRPWIGVNTTTGTAQFEATNPFKLTIPFINTGKTPAVNAEQAISWAISSQYLNGPPAKGAKYVFQPAGSIPPQGFHNLIVINRAVMSSYNSIISKQVFLYFWGEFRYHDTSGGTALHTTSFCMVFDPDMREMILCLNGNDMN